MGEAFNVVGDVGEGTNLGELEKSWGNSNSPWGSQFVGAVTEGCPMDLKHCFHLLVDL